MLSAKSGTAMVAEGASCRILSAAAGTNGRVVSAKESQLSGRKAAAFPAFDGFSCRLFYQIDAGASGTGGDILHMEPEDGDEEEMEVFISFTKAERTQQTASGAGTAHGPQGNGFAAGADDKKQGSPSFQKMG